MEFQVRAMARVGRGFIKAVAEVEYGGLRLRGIKLEERHGRLVLGMPGRRINDSWQLVVEVLGSDLTEQLEQKLAAEYRRLEAA